MLVQGWLMRRPNKTVACFPNKIVACVYSPVLLEHGSYLAIVTGRFAVPTGDSLFILTLALIITVCLFGHGCHCTVVKKKI
jgi:hypothetical protein